MNDEQKSNGKFGPDMEDALRALYETIGSAVAETEMKLMTLGGDPNDINHSTNLLLFHLVCAKGAIALGLEAKSATVRERVDAILTAFMPDLVEALVGVAARGDMTGMEGVSAMVRMALPQEAGDATVGPDPKLVAVMANVVEASQSVN